VEAAELSNPLSVESNMVDDAQIFNIRVPVSFERLKLGVCIDYEELFGGMQKLGQRGHDLV